MGFSKLNLDNNACANSDFYDYICYHFNTVSCMLTKLFSIPIGIQ